MAAQGTHEYMWNFEAGFKSRLEAFIAASGGRVYVVSGYRSNEHQAQLYAEGQAKYGANVNMWVAPPGSSNHNHGLAADLGYHGDGLAWAQANAAAFGLEFPMGHENWHIEPMGLRNGTYNGQPVTGDAYTIPPMGGEPVNQARDIGAQMQTLMSMLEGNSNLNQGEPVKQQDKRIEGVEQGPQYVSAAEQEDREVQRVRANLGVGAPVADDPMDQGGHEGHNH